MRGRAASLSRSESWRGPLTRTESGTSFLPCSPLPASGARCAVLRRDVGAVILIHRGLHAGHNVLRGRVDAAQRVVERGAGYQLDMQAAPLGLDQIVRVRH